MMAQSSDRGRLESEAIHYILSESEIWSYDGPVTGYISQTIFILDRAGTTYSWGYRFDDVDLPSPRRSFNTFDKAKQDAREALQARLQALTGRYEPAARSDLATS
jgi:hypothetical protein